MRTRNFPSATRLLAWTILLSAMNATSKAATPTPRAVSPNGRNSIELSIVEEHLCYTAKRDGRVLVGPSRLGPSLTNAGDIGHGCDIVDAKAGKIDQTFDLPWGNTKTVSDRCETLTATLENKAKMRWQVEIRAYDDGIAFRYHLPTQEGLKSFAIREETTRFDVADNPVVLFNPLDGFTTSHETLYEKQPLSELPSKRLMDCPILVDWADGPAAAITEACVRDFAGMYLVRESEDSTALRCRLSPLPSSNGPEVVCVQGRTPHSSPWRVVLLADDAGELIESNLLLCLNDPPTGDFGWAKPGKTTFHWWFGEFEDDHKLTNEREVYVARHKRYIDFCAENNIAYHSVSGDGRAWYPQTETDYGKEAPDADPRVARPELGLPEILSYAKKKGVGIRLWVHWKALDKNLDETLAVYESWGVKGLMVDFLDRDDQEMLDWVDRMLASAAKHKIHIQIHGSSKYSGEQRTFPNLFNREGVLNLEYSKWSDLCTPAHAVNVAYTRALAGPVDFHLGGFRAVSRAEFKPRDRAPNIMGTRCHQLALYVVYENPMPMVADAPQSYDGQIGFDFVRRVPTTWDETRFVAGKPGEFIVVARRSGTTWYLSGITNWTRRKIDLPLDFLSDGRWNVDLYADGSLDESKPNEVKKSTVAADKAKTLAIEMASGGGFVAVFDNKK